MLVRHLFFVVITFLSFSARARDVAASFPMANGPRLQIIVDKAPKGESPTAQTLSVYLDQKLIHKYFVSTGLESDVITSSGRASDRVTPVGIFRIYDRQIDYESKTWLKAKMPYAQFFHDGAAIHASTEFGYFRQRDSGGCVRVHPRNAKVLWDLVDRYGVQNTVVVVFDGTERALR